MAQHVVPLHQDIHRQLKLTTKPSYHEFADRHLLPLSVHEFCRASAEYPIVFVKDSESGQFKAVVLLSLKPGINLYAVDQASAPVYWPQALCNYPLVLIADPKLNDQYHVGIHTTSSQLNEQSGEALFTVSGEETPFLQHRKQALIQSFEQQQVTDAVIQLLLKLQLLQPYRFSIELQGESLQLDGIYSVSEQQLQQLSSVQFDELRQRGLLAAVYAQINSLHQFHRLAARHVQSVT